MHFAVPMLISFIVCVTAIENPEDYQARAYDYEPQYEYNGVDQRFFRPTTTTTTTSTSTSTVTCTRSVANPCGGRRRRDILDEENSEEHQFPISPSVVQRYILLFNSSQDLNFYFIVFFPNDIGLSLQANRFEMLVLLILSCYWCLRVRSAINLSQLTITAPTTIARCLYLTMTNT